MKSSPDDPGIVCASRFDEYASLQSLRFHFRDRSQPLSYVSLLAHNMHLYPSVDLLQATYHVPTEFDSHAVALVLQQLRPEHVRVLWASKSVAAAATEREAVYGTPFSSAQLPADWLDAWRADAIDPALSLPPSNPFIPHDLDMVAADEGRQAPVLIVDEPACRLWHALDVHFNVPKAVMYVDVLCAGAYVSPEAAMHTRLIIKLLTDTLNELTYPAELAGLYYWVGATTTGMTLYLAGYHDKMPTLLGFVLDALADFRVVPDRFAIVKEQLIKELKNTR